MSEITMTGTGSYPPLLTGGLIRLGEAPVAPWSRAVDFLTLTLSAEDGGWLRGQCELDQVGVPRPGFASSERLRCLGGHVWRRWQPRQPSRLFGHEYESWEWERGTADLWARRLTGRGRPSRVDVAYDFEVPAQLTVSEFVERVQHRFALARRGWSGEVPHLTHYVGAVASEARIAIYRKDVQQGVVWGALELPAVLRIELRLRGSLAVDWWAEWSRHSEGAFAMANDRIGGMLGFRVQEDVAEWSKFEVPDVIDPAQELLTFIEQHGARVAEWSRAGVPVIELAEQALARRPRMARWRASQRLQRLQEVGVESVVEVVRSAIDR